MHKGPAGPFLIMTSRSLASGSGFEAGERRLPPGRCGLTGAHDVVTDGALVAARVVADAELGGPLEAAAALGVAALRTPLVTGLRP